MLDLAGYLVTQDLRRRMLPGEMGADDEFDGEIGEVGREVAGMFDRFTGRILRRGVEMVFEAAADQPSITLPLYPVEEIHEVLLCDRHQETDVTGRIADVMRNSGVVRFDGAPGGRRQHLKIKVTGGYHCPPGDVERPATAVELPADLLGAFIVQCRAVCEAENLFRQRGARSADRAREGYDLTTLRMTPAAREVLTLYIAYS